MAEMTSSRVARDGVLVDMPCLVMTEVEYSTIS